MSSFSALLFRTLKLSLELIYLSTIACLVISIVYFDYRDVEREKSNGFSNETPFNPIFLRFQSSTMSFRSLSRFSSRFWRSFRFSLNTNFSSFLCFWFRLWSQLSLFSSQIWRHFSSHFWSQFWSRFSPQFLIKSDFILNLLEIMSYLTMNGRQRAP